jgi:signal transduction histidine kinase
LHAAIDEAMTTVAVEMEHAARAQLEEEARFRERFIGIVGHDLRSPLGAITFAAAVLLQQDECSDAQSRVVRRIARSADRMARMIRDLLDFTRSREGGGMPLTRRPTDLRAVCRQVVEEAELANPRREVHFTAQGDVSGVWDADRLAQVASNLLGNALGHGPTDGLVHLRLRDRGAGSVLLEVHNDGPPIPPDLLPALFDPFRRSARADVGTADGLGLGLFIVHQIVAAHGGTIRVTSDAVQGTTFSVELPRST